MSSEEIRIDSKVMMDNILKELSDLPSLPAIVSQLIELLNDPEANVKDLQTIISHDQALTAKILRLANSAYYGFSRRISTITEAVIILGFATIKSLAFAASAFKMFNSRFEGYTLNKGDFWKHSLVSALSARIIAHRIKYRELEVAFIAGLMHDIGKMVLSRYVKNSFMEIMRQVTVDKKNFAEAERSVLGFDHAAIGGKVAQKWNLPKTFHEVITYHHQPELSKEEKPLTAIVHVADSLALMMGYGLGVDGLNYPLSREALKTTGLSKNDFKEIIVQVEASVKEIESVFTDGLEG